MSVLKTVGIFVAAVVAELGGAYLIWRWRRLGASVLLIPAGLGALFAYAVVQTFQDTARFGRVYAAYAGVFLLGAMVWGWAIDGVRPDRFDVVGASIVLLGAGVVLWGRDVLG